jgi:hypothetical protein
MIMKTTIITSFGALLIVVAVSAGVPCEHPTAQPATPVIVRADDLRSLEVLQPGCCTATGQRSQLWSHFESKRETETGLDPGTQLALSIRYVWIDASSHNALDRRYPRWAGNRKMIS